MKIEEQVLSREQMAHLVELGVDTSDASMAWFMSPKTKQWKIKVKNNFSHELLLRLSPERYIPTYTIGDLIEKLPRHIDGRHETYLSITNDQLFGDWCVCYESKWGSETDWFTSSNLLTALYDCLCWVAENHKELIK